MYLLHLVDMRDYLIDATPVSAATSLPVPRNANGKGKISPHGPIANVR